MSNPRIICVAITGSLPTRAKNPAVPITVMEQIESTHEAFEASASIVHAHVHNDDQTLSSDPEKFAALKEGLEKHCPGMIIQFSTGVAPSNAALVRRVVDQCKQYERPLATWAQGSRSADRACAAAVNLKKV